jgi:hypothetical protein
MPHKQKNEKTSKRKRAKLNDASSTTRYIIISSCLFSFLVLFITNLNSAIIITLIFTNCLSLAHIYQITPQKYRKKFEFDSHVARTTSCEIQCCDAIQWLREISVIPGYVITSLPDYGAMNMPVDEWKIWFSDLITLIMNKLDDQTCAIFYQTDAKVRDVEENTDKKLQTEWIDKSVLCFNAATKVPGVKLLWHKIMDRTNDETVNRAKVGYSHLICFGKNKGMTMEKNEVPDVLERGDLLYKNSVGINACMIAALFCKTAGATKVVDPFCGRGSFLMAANYVGLDALGIDINKQCARQAKQKVGSVTKGFARIVREKSFLHVE